MYHVFFLPSCVLLLFSKNSNQNVCNFFCCLFFETIFQQIVKKVLSPRTKFIIFKKMSHKQWLLLADISNVGKKRLRVLEKSSSTGETEHSVDAQALEQILNSCSAASVKEVEQILSLSSANGNSSSPDQQHGEDDDDSMLLSKVLLRYAVLSDAFRREQQANDILTNALQISLKAVEAARDELDEVRAERDALKQALSMK
jgi:hypothetical protein